MSSELAAWLRRQREDRGWTRSELARQLIRAARARGDTSVPGAGNIRIAEALDRRQWPRDAAELYLLAGCLSALMAAAAVNLGYPQAAEELTRAGWAYAAIIDHRPLMARLRLCAAYAAYWSGRPALTADLARDGLGYCADGQSAAQLHLLGGLAAACRGDAGSARQAIGAAADARDREHLRPRRPRAFARCARH